ncbi:MAG: ABC transporter substrate-binding protein [Firmicutes bacterium]|nr:ABC transporter substrate-binding protein [Bacillota bacterium]
MKKNLYILLTLIISILVIGIYFGVINNKDNNSDLDKLTLGEVTHSVFYAPMYVAIENGYFEDEGIEIDLVLTSGADKVSAAVLSGDVEIGFAGAESAIYIYDKGEKDYLQIFSGLTKRDGQFILSRNKLDNFSLEDLYDKEILVGRKSGMPALNFLNALKKEGIDQNRININYSVDFAALSGTFIGGTGDYVNLFEPNALKLEQEEYGYVVESIGKLSGEMPYTAFYARKSFIKNNTEIIKKFTNAINRGLAFTHNNTASIIAQVILDQFPDTSLNDLTILIDRYKQSDSWLETTYISEKLLQNLEDIMIDNDLLKSYVPYKDLIVNYE